MKDKIVETKSLKENCTLAPYSVIYENVELGYNVQVGEHAVIGRLLKPTSAMVRKTNLKGKVTIADNVSISAHTVIYTGVEIGSNSLIGDHTSILSNVKIGKEVLISRHVTINSDVTIGDNSRIMDNTHITGRTIIGENVFISVGVSMANDSLFGKNGFNDEVQGPIIEDFVSIGVGVTILPSIKIGKGSIIAAGTIVKENVPENVIYGGNPAKVISRVPKYMKRYEE